MREKWWKFDKWAAIGLLNKGNPWNSETLKLQSLLPKLFLPLGVLLDQLKISTIPSRSEQVKKLPRFHSVHINEPRDEKVSPDIVYNTKTYIENFKKNIKTQDLGNFTGEQKWDDVWLPVEPVKKHKPKCELVVEGCITRVPTHWIDRVPRIHARPNSWCYSTSFAREISSCLFDSVGWEESKKIPAKHVTDVPNDLPDDVIDGSDYPEWEIANEKMAEFEKKTPMLLEAVPAERRDIDLMLKRGKYTLDIKKGLVSDQSNFNKTQTQEILLAIRRQQIFHMIHNRFRYEINEAYIKHLDNSPYKGIFRGRPSERDMTFAVSELRDYLFELFGIHVHFNLKPSPIIMTGSDLAFAWYIQGLLAEKAPLDIGAKMFYSTKSKNNSTITEILVKDKEEVRYEKEFRQLMISYMETMKK